MSYFYDEIGINLVSLIMGWLNSAFNYLFHPAPPKHEKTIKVFIGSNVVGMAENLVFKTLPSTEYFIKCIEIWVPNLIIDAHAASRIFSCLEQGKQLKPFNVDIEETNKKTIHINDVMIEDFGKFTAEESWVIFENVTLNARSMI